MTSIIYLMRYAKVRQSRKYISKKKRQFKDTRIKNFENRNFDMQILYAVNYDELITCHRRYEFATLIDGTRFPPSGGG